MLKLKRVLSCTIVFVLLLTAVSIFDQKSGLTASAESSAEIQAQLDKVQQESNRLQAEISALESANAPFEQQRAAVKKQINAIVKEINLFESKIAACENEIKQLEKEIADLEAKCEKQSKEFKKRLVAIYTGNNSFLSDLSFLMSSESLSDYLAKAELIETMSRRDNKIINDLKKDVEAVQVKIAEQEDKKAEINESKKEVDAKKVELNKQYAKINSIVVSNEEEIRLVEQEAAEKKQIMKDLQKALEEAKLYENGAVGTGQFAWPVIGFYKVTSPFGQRTHPVTGEKQKMHYGTDIAGAGVYGARIVAADSGTVILSKYYGFYGNCVMIDHNNGYVTLYAHMKSLSPLKVGDMVIKGTTTVGYVGQSGRVDGPHLHFEVMKNGNYLDPMSFF